MKSIKSVIALVATALLLTAGWQLKNVEAQAPAPMYVENFTQLAGAGLAYACVPDPTESFLYSTRYTGGIHKTALAAKGTVPNGALLTITQYETPSNAAQPFAYTIGLSGVRNNVLFGTTYISATLFALDISTDEARLIAGKHGTRDYWEGTGESARFRTLVDVNYNAAGNGVYVADMADNRIRVVAADHTTAVGGGTTSLLAGSGTAGTLDNTDRSLVQFNQPTSAVPLVLQATEYVYVSCYVDFSAGIRRVDARTGATTTLFQGASSATTFIDGYASTTGRIGRVMALAPRDYNSFWLSTEAGDFGIVSVKEDNSDAYLVQATGTTYDRPLTNTRFWSIGVSGNKLFYPRYDWSYTFYQLTIAPSALAFPVDHQVPIHSTTTVSASTGRIHTYCVQPSEDETYAYLGAWSWDTSAEGGYIDKIQLSSGSHVLHRNFYEAIPGNGMTTSFKKVLSMTTVVNGRFFIAARNMVAAYDTATDFARRIVGHDYYGGTDGTGTTAGFDYAWCVCRSRLVANKLFVTDFDNHLIRSVTADHTTATNGGVAGTVAGVLRTGGSTDGTTPTFAYPISIVALAVGGVEYLFVGELDPGKGLRRINVATKETTRIVSGAGFTPGAIGTATLSRSYALANRDDRSLWFFSPETMEYGVLSVNNDASSVYLTKVTGQTTPVEPNSWLYGMGTVEGSGLLRFYAARTEGQGVVDVFNFQNHQCIADEYEVAAPQTSPVQDRACRSVTQCTVGSTFEYFAPTTTSDRICAPVSPACVAGTTYESAAPTNTSDRVCTPVSVCNASLGAVEVVAPTLTSDRQCGPACSCNNALTANYKNTLVPDAAKDATTTISLNTDLWHVEFKVENVASLTNGHVIASAVDAQQDVATAITPSVSNFRADQLWNPPSCALSEIDVPAASLGVAVDLTTSPTSCVRSYTVRYSLINPADRTTHCQLSNTADNEVLVECELQLNSIRAYDLTAPNVFLTKESVLRANITMPRNLPNEVSTLLHASLAKCSVYASPDFFVDCRIPSLWNFAPTFAVTQSPSWIIDSSCVQTNGTDATYVRCDLQSISQIYTQATATIAATVLPSGETMNFKVNYTLPREETATATGSLASFVKSIGTKDGKFFYGNDDLLTLEIEVVDTARLQITDISLFNSDSPIQSYDLRSTPQFETVESQNATFFVIAFYPARILSDGNFYRHGPHGVNVSFLFTAARRQAPAPKTGDTGVVTYNGLALKAPRRQEASNGDENSAATGLSNSIVAGIAAGALVAVVAVVAASVLIVRRRRAAPAAASKAVADEVPAQAEEDVKAAVAVEIDEV